MTILWLDVTAGAAGDMILGALVDAGAPLDLLLALPDRLGLHGVTIATGRVRRGALTALSVQVDVESPSRGDAPRGHAHHHDDPHHHGHPHGHHPHGPSRTWRHIRDLLGGVDLPAGVRQRAIRVFERLAEVEARAHGVPVDRVHFHEVGGEDALVDIVGACLLLDALQVDTIVASALPAGSGTVHTAHGELPVPVPAVLGLVEGWPIVQDGRSGELVTPTGAALVTTLARPGPCPSMVPTAVGHGAGARDDPLRPNIVRAVLGRPLPTGTGRCDGDQVAILAANIDDMPGEAVPELLERLMEAGALDVTCTPTLMKKGRPAVQVQALAPPEAAAAVTRAFLRHSTTLGVRRWTADRTVLDRRTREVETPLGPIRVKEAILDGKVLRRAPEHEDCLRAARRHGVPLLEVHRRLARWLEED